MKNCPKMKTVVEQLAARHGVDLAQTGAYLRLDMEGFDRLCIEKIATGALGARVSIAHFYEADGYPVADPKIVFFTAETRGWIPFEITQTLIGTRSYVQLSWDGTRIVRYQKAAQADLADFAELWAQNIIDQGWLEWGIKHEDCTHDFNLASGQEPLFALGQVVATPGALAALETVGQAPHEFLTRHVCGQWGDLDEHDRNENEQALTRGGRLFSAYRLSDGTRIWLITEHDRSVSTILLPSEY